MSEKNKQAWDRQWQGNLVSTCLLHADPESGQAVIEGWATFFTQLSKGAKVLDVGTGNGFLTLLAQDAGNRLGLEFDIHGSDYAAIDPVKAVPEQSEGLSGITFHAGVATENLPFPDDSFDAVMSQHALEYGDVQKSVNEISRILKPGGRARFLLHAKEGEIVRSNLPKIAQCRHVLGDAKLFEIARAAVEEALAGKGDEGLTLRTALSSVASRFKDDGNTRDLAELLGLVWGAYEARENFPDFAAFAAWLEENRLETEAQMLRIEAMSEAALSKEEAEALKTDMVEAGFKDIALNEDKNPGTGAVYGWIIEAARG